MQGKTTDLSDFLRGFHSCALLAYVEVARETGRWPDSELTRIRAYRLYEQWLKDGQEPDCIPWEI